MSDAPSFQFYPKDWRNSANLQRCGLAARGAWMECMCLLHDSTEYGVLRWPLADIAQAAHVPVELLQELAAKGVLKGADACSEDFTHRPFHAGKHGEPVALVKADGGPCWYSSRFVKDAWLRSRRGASTRFDTENQPLSRSPSGTPTRPLGERQGDGPSSASASASSKPKSERSKATAGRGSRLPADWALPPEWAAYCHDKRPDLNAEATALDFADWYHAAPSNKGGLKTDWLKTWQRWVRNQDPPRGSPRAANNQPSKHMTGVAGFLGVDPHELIPGPRVVLATDRPGLGEPVPAGPRRLSGE